MIVRKFNRVLLKLSGESLKGSSNSEVFKPEILDYISGQIELIIKQGIQLAIVIGGGNIWRGEAAASRGMDRSAADYAGMLATVINALALQDALERRNLITRTQTALTIHAVAESYIRRRAIRHLEKGRIVIFASGTGNPYMTTDTAASLRAVEIDAEVLLMAKNNVDGVYDSDPKTNSNAKKYKNLTYMEAINKKLEVMDSTALSLCMDNNLPVIVFDIFKPGNILEVLLKQNTGSYISG
tara:strand:+ start:1318 stop:2040 length:723 start_codon:yes stop_codon:yes gene_type:complete